MEPTIDMAVVRAQLDALAAFPNQLRAQLRGLNDAQVRFRPAPDAWSIVEIVGHLADVDVINQMRVGKIVSGQNPALEQFDGPAAVQRAGYQTPQALALAHAFAERREAFVAELRFLRPAARARAGTHATRGLVSIADIIATLASHDPAHLQHIKDVLAAQ
jgi:hypothetical protein